MRRRRASSPGIPTWWPALTRYVTENPLIWTEEVARYLFVWITLIGFVVFYSTLAVVDVYLMVKTVKAGPPSDEPGRNLDVRFAAVEAAE